MKANGMITLQRYVDVFIKTYFLEEGLPIKSWHMKSLDSQHLTKKNLIYNLKKAYILACMWKKMHVRILVGFWSFFCFHRINNWIHIFIFVIFFHISVAKLNKLSLHCFWIVVVSGVQSTQFAWILKTLVVEEKCFIYSFLFHFTHSLDSYLMPIVFVCAACRRENGYFCLKFLQEVSQEIYVSLCLERWMVLEISEGRFLKYILKLQSPFRSSCYISYSVHWRGEYLKN